MQTKCIGGVLDGQYVNCREPRHLGYAPHPQMAHIVDSFSDGPDSIVSAAPTIYRLRFVQCNGEQIFFYAPDDWTDLEALQEALG